jgi:glutamine synthetase
MPVAGIPVEVAQGEGGVGQFEVTLAHAEPLEMADRHVVYKHGVKALAHRHGLAATFMAKPREGEAGSSCHIHLSLARDGESALTAADGSLSQVGAAFVAGLVRFAPDFCLLYAPYANSYRRLQPGSWAPANLTWGLDNRTVLVRVCGSANARRLEFRLPGADANPYLAIAALIAAGIAGVEQDLTPAPATAGDGYAADAPRLPRELGEAVERFAASSVVADALGVPVRQHLAGLGAHERDIAWREVTDRDLVRGFETA